MPGGVGDTQTEVILSSIATILTGISDDLSNVAFMGNLSTALNAWTGASITTEVASGVALTGPNLNTEKFALVTLALDVTGANISGFSFSVRGGYTGIPFTTLFTAPASSATSTQIIQISTATVAYVRTLNVQFTNASNLTGADGTATVLSTFMLHL